MAGGKAEKNVERAGKASKDASDKHSKGEKSTRDKPAGGAGDKPSRERNAPERPQRDSVAADRSREKSERAERERKEKQTKDVVDRSSQSRQSEKSSTREVALRHGGASSNPRGDRSHGTQTRATPSERAQVNAHRSVKDSTQQRNTPGSNVGGVGKNARDLEKRAEALVRDSKAGDHSKSVGLAKDLAKQYGRDHKVEVNTNSDGRRLEKIQVTVTNEKTKERTKIEVIYDKEKKQSVSRSETVDPKSGKTTVEFRQRDANGNVVRERQEVLSRSSERQRFSSGPELRINLNGGEFSVRDSGRTSMPDVPRDAKERNDTDRPQKSTSGRQMSEKPITKTKDSSPRAEKDPARVSRERGLRDPLERERSTGRTSRRGMDDVIRHEGHRELPYKDQAGIWTIGVGHAYLKGEKPPVRISMDEVRQLLQQDLAIAERAVRHQIKAPLSQAQFDVLVSFTFNLGARRLQKIAARINANDFVGAANNLRLYNKVRNPKTKQLEVSKGLDKRRAEEAAVLETQLFDEPKQQYEKDITDPFAITLP